MDAAKTPPLAAKPNHLQSYYNPEEQICSTTPAASPEANAPDLAQYQSLTSTEPSTARDALRFQDSCPPLSSCPEAAPVMEAGMGLPLLLTGAAALYRYGNISNDLLTKLANLSDLALLGSTEALQTLRTYAESNDPALNPKGIALRVLAFVAFDRHDPQQWLWITDAIKRGATVELFYGSSVITDLESAFKIYNLPYEHGLKLDYTDPAWRKVVIELTEVCDSREILKTFSQYVTTAEFEKTFPYHDTRDDDHDVGMPDEIFFKSNKLERNLYEKYFGLSAQIKKAKSDPKKASTLPLLRAQLNKVLDELAEYRHFLSIAGQVKLGHEAIRIKRPEVHNRREKRWLKYKLALVEKWNSRHPDKIVRSIDWLPMHFGEQLDRERRDRRWVRENRELIEAWHALTPAEQEQYRNETRLGHGSGENWVPVSFYNQWMEKKTNPNLTGPISETDRDAAGEKREAESTEEVENGEK